MGIVFYWAPSDVFGSGKVLVSGEVIDKGGQPYSADIRGVLKGYASELYKKKGYTLNAANEIEGFLFKGPDAERHFNETGKSEYVNTGGYYHSLPGDPLRTFHRHNSPRCAARDGLPEREGPSGSRAFVQFEINYGYGEVVQAADQIQALQADLPSGRDEPGLYRVFPAQAGGRRERQRHAYKRLNQRKEQEHLLGRKRRRKSSSKLGWAFTGTAFSPTATTFACC